MSKQSTIFMMLAAIVFTVIVAVIILSSRIADTEAVKINTSGYMLKEYNGSLALFKAESEKPYEILDTAIEQLNSYDRELVIAGIGVSTEEELRALIEDYTS